MCSARGPSGKRPRRIGARSEAPRGFHEEAQTQCYAIQAVRQLSEDLGFGSDQAQRLATYALGYFDVPDSYQSTECKRGGALDLDPDEPAWP